MSENIRLRFSGLVIFSARLVSLVTGIIVLVTIARSLSQAQYGAWANIASLITTLTIPATVFPFWSTRYYARGFKGALTLGLVVNLGLASLAAIIAVLVSPILASAAGTLSIFYIYAATVIVVSYSVSALEGIVSVKATHVIGYGILAFEFTKTGLTVFLMTTLHWGVAGAITALFAANCTWIVVYVWTLRGQWHQKMEFAYMKQWIKGSFLNFYLTGAGLVASLEGFILLFLAGPIALSFYYIAGSITLPIGTTAALSAALYPKLLTGGTGDDVEVALRLNFLFSIPLTIFVIVLSPSLLAILSSSVDYVPAATIVIVGGFRGLWTAIGGIFDAVITGTEKLDEKGLVSLNAVVRSRIFRASTFSYIDSIIYLPLLWIILQPYHTIPLNSALVTALIGTLATLTLVSVKGVIARRSLRFGLQLRSFTKVLVVSLIIASPVLILKQPLPVLTTITLLIAGGLIYTVILYIIEEEARLLIDSILERIQTLIGSFLDIV